MKHIQLTVIVIFILTFSVCSVSAQSLRMLLRLPEKIIEPKWERTAQGDQQLNYYNEDFCNYYLYRQDNYSRQLRPGKNTIFTIKKDTKTENQFQNASRYKCYRGGFPKKIQPETLYALPVKDGQKTGWQIDKREPHRTMQFHIKEGDTVYATRNGIACYTVDLQHILIYHADYTFAAYLNMTKRIIQPGKEVMVGQPIGIAGNKGVSISYFFLDQNKFQGNIPISGHPYSHFIPVFRTSEGDIKPEEKKLYEAIVNDELIMLEMNKKEQKKFLKNR